MYERDEWHSPLAIPRSLGVFVVAGGTRSPVGSRLSGLRQALSRRTMAAVGRQRPYPPTGVVDRTPCGLGA